MDRREMEMQFAGSRGLPDVQFPPEYLAQLRDAMGASAGRFMPPTLDEQREGMRQHDYYRAMTEGTPPAPSPEDMRQRIVEQLTSAPTPPSGAMSNADLEFFRRGVPTPYGRDAQQMRDHNAMLSAAQTQYANDRPIQVFRPGIPNPPWGWDRR